MMLFCHFKNQGVHVPINKTSAWHKQLLFHAYFAWCFTSAVACLRVASASGRTVLVICRDSLARFVAAKCNTQSNLDFFIELAKSNTINREPHNEETKNNRKCSWYHFQRGVSKFTQQLQLLKRQFCVWTKLGRRWEWQNRCVSFQALYWGAKYTKRYRKLTNSYANSDQWVSLFGHNLIINYISWYWQDGVLTSLLCLSTFLQITYWFY